MSIVRYLAEKIHSRGFKEAGGTLSNKWISNRATRYSSKVHMIVHTSSMFRWTSTTKPSRSKSRIGFRCRPFCVTGIKYQCFMINCGTLYYVKTDMMVLLFTFIALHVHYYKSLYMLCYYNVSLQQYIVIHYTIFKS